MSWFRKNSFIRTTSVLAVTLAFLVVNLGAYFAHGRLDLTAGSIYTLSAATEKIVDSLAEPIMIKVFLSEKLPPQVANVKQSLVDALAEYAVAGGSKLHVVYVDPASNPDAANLARSLGIPELSLNVIEADQQQILKTYFGLAVLKEKKEKPKDGNPLDAFEKYETIPVIQNMGDFEYDLTAAIKKVGTAETKTIGFLIGHDEHELRPGADDPNQNNPFIQQLMAQNQRLDYVIGDALRKNYTVQTVSITKDKPAITGIDTLIIAGPQRALAEYELAAVHSFVKTGHNAVFLLDGVTIDETMSATPAKDNFAALTAPWGITLEQVLVADASHGQAAFNQGFITFQLPYPLWPRITEPSPDSPITSRLSSVVLPWTSPLTITTIDGVTTTTLLASSSHYARVTAAAATPAKDGKEATPAQPIDLNPQRDFGISTEAKTPLPLAVLAQKKGEGTVVIIGSSGFPTDRLAGSAKGATDFLLNAVDALTLGDELVAIRSKQITDRPLITLTEIEKNIIVWGNILLAPLAVVVYGLIRRQIRLAKRGA